jgi:hypothetical protein
VQNNNLACICIKGYGRRVFDIQNAKLAKNAKVLNLVNGKIYCSARNE